jgi:cation:H+ antiporter
MTYLLLIVSISLLIIAGEALVKSSVDIALRFHIPMVIVGLTVVSFATSAPELVVSLDAALMGKTDIALGNVIGSNIANLSIVLGPTALLFPILVKARVSRIDWPFMFLMSILFASFIYTDNIISHTEGFILFGMLIGYILLLIRSTRKEIKQLKKEKSDRLMPLWKTILFLMFGVIGLKYGAEILIDQVIVIARENEVSERVISLTLVAFGTSIPELVASIMAAVKGEEDLSVGNLIGSNIFNIGAVLGITSIISEIPMQEGSDILNDLPWMLFVAVFIIFVILLSKEKKIGRYAGAGLLAFYLLYMFILYFRQGL